MRRAAVAVLLAAGAAFASAGQHAPPAVAAAAEQAEAAQAEVHRAVVVVDLGNGEVRSACVRFRQQSITGIDLLRAARMDPVVQTYAGPGGAVCKLCGVGCSAGSDCLTCQAPKYWQYWRSDGGTGTYTYSQRGAGDTAVTDGDVEGWSWSDSEDPPPFLTVAEACSGPNVYDHQPPSAATSTTTTAASTATTATTAPAPTGTARPAASTTILAGPEDRTAPTTSPVLLGAGATTSTTAPAPSGEADGEAAAAAPARSSSRGGEAAPQGGGGASSQVMGLLAFAAVLAGLLGWRANMRWSRRAR